MGEMRSKVLAAAVALVVAGSLAPAHARVPAAASQVDPVRTGARLRALLESGSLANAVLAATSLRHDDVQAHQELPLGPVPATTPEAIAHPVALLLGAVDEAGQLIRDSVRHDVDLALARQALHEAVSRIGRWRPGDPVPRLPEMLGPDAADSAALGRALLVIAQAIDAALRTGSKHPDSTSSKGVEALSANDPDFGATIV
jgi:hypothetical protein